MSSIWSPLLPLLGGAYGNLHNITGLIAERESIFSRPLAENEYCRFSGSAVTTKSIHSNVHGYGKFLFSHFSIYATFAGV